MWMSLACLVVLSAEPMTPARAAQVVRDTEAAKAAVAAQFGNKDPKELKGDEKVRYLRALNDAKNKVLDDAGVDPGSWALYQRRHAKEITAAKGGAKAGAGGAKAADTVEIVTGDGSLDEAGSGSGEVVIEKGTSGASGKKGKR